MAVQMLNAPQAQRVGIIRGELLAHAVAVECLGITGTAFNMDRNKGQTIKYRRYLPRGATNSIVSNPNTGAPLGINTISVDPNAHLLQEGVTPLADTLIAQDITVTMQQYGCVYSYSDIADDMYEDDIPEEMMQQAGERMGLVREMIRYGALKGCTNRYFAGGTSRATVDEPVSLPVLRLVARSIMGNRGRMINRVLAASMDYGTSPIEPSVIVFHHTDVESDVRNLAGFIPCAAYGTRKQVHDMEVGACERFRFVGSPELAGIPDSGAALGSTGLQSTTGANVDVYPMIVVAANAWGDVALRGMRAMTPIHIPASKPEKSDLLGQRGYIGSKFYSVCFVQNDGWMAVIEAGITDLTP